jgi:hypothetical protein
LEQKLSPPRLKIGRFPSTIETAINALKRKIGKYVLAYSHVVDKLGITDQSKRFPQGLDKELGKLEAARKQVCCKII